MRNGEYVSVVVPTRNRAANLRQCLRSLLSQNYPLESYEIIVVDNGSTDNTFNVVMESAERISHPPIRLIRQATRGLNRARNAGIAAASGDPICFVDDDVIASPGWLSAMVAGFSCHPEAGCFGGPIRLRLEGKAPRMCGTEPLGETELELGYEERVVSAVWGANMAVTKAALDGCGYFDERIEIYGDEEEWERRLISRGGSVIYLPRAWVWHRRSAESLRIRALLRSRFHRGIKQTEFRHHQREAVQTGGEFKLFCRGLGHAVRSRCCWGLLAASESAGRVWGTFGKW